MRATSEHVPLLPLAWTSASYALDPSEVARLPSPALVIFLDQVRHNIETVLARLGGRPDRWRPHLKTTKSPRLWGELLERGVRHFKCATVGEADALLDLARGLDLSVDLLSAHPHHGPAVERIAELARRHAQSRVGVLVESLGDVERWPAPLRLFVDLDPGMHRTGVAAAARANVLELARAAGERFAGLHWYDGHHTDADPALRASAAQAGYRELVDLTLDLVRRGVAVSELVTSGTPALGAALDFDPFVALAELGTGTAHRVSPGTVVLHDLRSEELDRGLGFGPAALVLTRVVSRPREGRATCDAGSKSISCDGGLPVAQVLDWPRLVPAQPSEEHLPLDAAPGSTGELPARGALLWLVPRHVCTTVNLYDEAVLVEGGRIVGRAPITARGHALWGVE